MGDYKKLLAYKKGFDLGLACNYISNQQYEELMSLNNEVGKFIWYMINNPDKFMQRTPDS